MEVKALIVVGGAGEGEWLQSPRATTLALADVLGRPAVCHIVDHLYAQNISDIAVVSEFAPAPETSGRARASLPRWTVASRDQLWRTAEAVFNDLAQNGAEEILVMRMGAYLEPDVESLLQAHIENRTHATRAVDANGSPMDLFVVTASRRNEAAYLLRRELNETRTPCGAWEFRGYANALETAHHLRCLAVDAFLGENGIVPAGREVRPGVWVAKRASVHPRARILAPAFVGEHARVHSNAVITRCSVVERNAEVGAGTVVEDSTVLPFTYVGEGLDVMHAVAGENRLASLDRDVEIEIADPRLMHALPRSTLARWVAAATGPISFLLPRRAFSWAARGRRHTQGQLPQAVSKPSALHTPPGFPAPSTAVQVSSRTWQ